MREIKFRAWDKRFLEMTTWDKLRSEPMYVLDTDSAKIFQQFTGLVDKTDKEIYELMELDYKYRVIYIAPSYVLQDISNGDIMSLYDNQHTITKEYCPL